MDPGALSESEKKTAQELGFDLRVVENLKRIVKRPLRSYKDLYNCDEEGRDPRRYLLGHLAHHGMVSAETRKKGLQLQVDGISRVMAHSPTAKKALSESHDLLIKELAAVRPVSPNELDGWLQYQKRGLLFDVDDWNDALRSSVCPPGYAVEKIDEFSVQKDFATRAEAEKYRATWPWKQARIYDFSQRSEIMNFTVPLDRLTRLSWDGDEEVLSNGDNTFNVHRHGPFRVSAMVKVMVFYKV